MRVGDPAGETRYDALEQQSRVGDEVRAVEQRAARQVPLRQADPVPALFGSDHDVRPIVHEELVHDDVGVEDRAQLIELRFLFAWSVSRDAGIDHLNRPRGETLRERRIEQRRKRLFEVQPLGHRKRVAGREHP